MNKMLITSCALLLFLSSSTTHADEILNFLDVPNNISTKEAIEVVAYISEHYKWTVQRQGNNKLRVSIDHRGYKARLDFSFSDKNITYKDSTTYEQTDFDPFDTSNSSIVILKKPTPLSWMKNLRRGTKKRMAWLKRDNRQHIIIDNIKDNSPDSLESKLVGLKTVYAKGLITEKEYKIKKNEILSEY